ncbi:malonyl-ACP O-methyltransferase BioC [Legionella sp. W05-934-2]|jgi:malonyl-CoA O-methyltransferase|uniref:malonyl-ACP O-methyltransferase BioC n=1 Tax=Legionella sp. W05-934-2 TaxID=1198649 RepID=UPI00346319D5
MTRNVEIGKAFDRVATQYEKSAIIQQEIGNRLIERLDYLTITPTRILDLGCGVGQFSQALKKRYPKAHIVGIDLSYQMLNVAKLKQSWRSKWSLVGGDIATLPFANESFDLVFSNQAVHWVENVNALFSELHRIMAVNGCLMFSTLGPDTFKELSTVFKAIDDYEHVNIFQDMHDIGDSLLQAQWLDPVMDMEFITAQYASVNDLLKSLKRQGVKNIHPQRKLGLSGRQFLQQLSSLYQQTFAQAGKVPLTYEVVYGHAWRGELKSKTIGQDTFVPIDSIKRW